MMNRSQPVGVIFSDLEEVLTLLQSTLTYLQAQDVANAQVNLAEKVHYRALTRETQRVMTRFKGYVADALMEAYEGQDEEGYVGLIQVCEECGADYEGAECIACASDPEHEVEDDNPQVEEELPDLPDNPLGSKLSLSQPEFDWEGENKDD